MFKTNQNRVLKVCAFIIALILLLPNFVSLVHDIEHEHEIELCDNPNETHLHKVENHCDLCKFKLNQDYHIVKSSLDFVQITISKTLSFRSYSFQYNYQNLSFSLRAPPALV